MKYLINIAVYALLVIARICIGIANVVADFYNRRETVDIAIAYRRAIDEEVS